MLIITWGPQYERITLRDKKQVWGSSKNYQGTESLKSRFQYKNNKN